jgi:hypothetical protein
VLDLLAGLTFAGLLVVAAFAVRRPGRDPHARRRAGLLILYVIGASCTAGLSQRELWPFSAWTLMAGAAPDRLGAPPLPASVRAVAVDVTGREYPVDYRAWQPLTLEEIGTWWHRVLPALAADERRRAGAWMLERVNRARATVRAGGQPGYFHRFLGPLTAPTHSLHRATWTTPVSVPAEPFVAIRLYRASYELEARRRDPTRVRYDQVFEFAGDR